MAAATLPTTMSYIEWLRGRIGPRKTILIYSTVIVRDADGRVLLQQRSDFDWWGLPGGVLEFGEDILTCARRELHEETGLQVGTLRLVGLYSHPRYDVVYPNGDAIQQFTICLAGWAGGGRMQPDGVETLGLQYFAPDALSRLTIPAWYRAMLADLPAGSRTAAEWGPDVRLNGVVTHMDPVWQEPGSIMPAAVAVVRRADGRVYLPSDEDGGRRLPWRPVALGETAATTAVRAVGLPGCRPARLLGIISEPGGVAQLPGLTDHIVAGVFLLAAPAGVRTTTTDAAWVLPETLPDEGHPMQAPLRSQVAATIDGGSFVDGQREPARV